MVILRILDLELSEGVEHISTDWEVSSTMSFSSKDLQSLNDKKNKNTIIFNEVLDPNIKWYARARALLSTGYTVWGNVFVFLPDQDTVIEVSNDLPSRIGVPQITTSSKQNSHDVSLFTITATGFEVLGNSTHTATSWIVEDIHSEVIWASIYDTSNLTSIDVANFILKSNTIYRIKVILHSTSNDSSPIGCYTIKTSNNEDISLITYLDWVDVKEPLEIRINRLDNVNKITWSVLSMIKGYSQLIKKYELEGPSAYRCTIDTSIFRSDELYMLKIETDNKNLGAKFIPFRTKPFTTETNPELVVPDDDEELFNNNNAPLDGTMNKFHWSKSTLSIDEVLMLPDIEALPIAVEGDLQNIPQDIIIDSFTNMHNNTKRSYLLEPVNEQLKYLSDMGSLRFKITNYKGTNEFDILPLTDENGANIIKGSEPYLPVYVMHNGIRKEVRTNVLRCVLFDEFDNLVAFPTPSTNNLLLTKYSTDVRNEYYNVLTLSDGMFNAVHSDRAFGTFIKPIPSGNYKLCLVDVEDRRKHIIPFTITGSNLLRSRSDKKFFGISIAENNADKGELELYPMYKSSVYVDIPSGTEKTFKFSMINNVMGDLVGDEFIKVKDVTFEKSIPNRDELNETEIEKKREEFITKYGKYRQFMPYGTITLESKTDESYAFTLTSMDGEEVFVYVNTQYVPEDTSFTNINLEDDEKAALDITSDEQLNKICKGYALQKDGSYKDLSETDYDKINKELKAAAALMSTVGTDFSQIDIHDLTTYDDPATALYRETAINGGVAPSKPKTPKSGTYQAAAEAEKYSQPVTKFEYIFNASFTSRQFSVSVAAITNLNNKAKVVNEYNANTEAVKDKPRADFKRVQGHGEIGKFADYNLDDRPDDSDYTDQIRVGFCGQLGVIQNTHLTRNDEDGYTTVKEEIMTLLNTAEGESEQTAPTGPESADGGTETV